MTNEEAIKILEYFIDPYYSEEKIEAVNMAISALSNEAPEQAYNRGVADGKAEISKLHRYIQLKNEKGDVFGLTKQQLIIDEQRMLVLVGWFTVEALRQMGYEIVEVEE